MSKSKDKDLKIFIKTGPRENVVLWLLSLMAFPIVKMSLRLKISPNTLTTFSILCIFISGISIIVESISIAFLPFFLLGLILDFADGLVARSSEKIGSSAFDYDHISDLFKVSFITICISINLESQLFWVLSSSWLSLVLISTVLNHDLSFADKFNKISRKDLRQIVPLENPIFVNIVSLIFTYEAHTFLILAFIVLYSNFAYVLFIYLIFVSTYTTFRMIYVLSKTSIFK
jgi:phosphatidylglycerophosphate synthase